MLKIKMDQSLWYDFIFLQIGKLFYEREIKFFFIEFSFYGINS